MAFIQDIMNFLRLPANQDEIEFWGFLFVGLVIIVIFFVSTRAFLGVWILGVLCCWGFAAYANWNEYRELIAALPVEATVLSKTVDSTSNDDGDTIYRPTVRYEYELNGVPFSSSKVFLTREGTGDDIGRRMAQKTIDRFQIGQRVTAYYKPERPSIAFLLKRPSPTKFCFLVLFTVMILFFGHLAIVGLIYEEKGWSYNYEAKGWFFSFRARALLWHGTGLVLFGPYFLIAGRESGGMAVLFTAVYFAWGMWWIWDSQWASSLKLFRRVFLTVVFSTVFGGFAGGLIGNTVEQIAWLVFNRVFDESSWMIHGAAVGAVISIVALAVSALQGKDSLGRK